MIRIKKTHVDGNASIISKINCTFRLNSNTNGSSRIKWTKLYRINDWPVTFKIDTGADVNCIPINLIKKFNVSLNNTNVNCVVLDYSSNRVNIHGTINLMCFDPEKNLERSAEFLVVDDALEPLLGLSTCIEFGLIERLSTMRSLQMPRNLDEFVNKYRGMFDEVGKFPGKVSIKLKDDSVPSLHYKKRIPLSMSNRLKTELDQMVRAGIISPVNHPTDWVNNVQLVEKPDGKLRICLDPKPLNACIKREHFLIPTIDDVTSRLSGKRIFTVLDLSNGFWHMELDNKSAELTTFMTPFGRYKFNRLPFGVNCAPEIFQKKMVQTFGDIPNLIIYFDDIAIAAENEEEHDKTLSGVMERARENNVKFNSKKIQYKQNKITFMGHIISEGEIRPRHKYLRAILDIKKPRNRTEVMRLLGLFKYLAKFIPNLSKLSAEMRNLTRKDVEWTWTDTHDKELQMLLNTITSAPVLAIYDPLKRVIVQTDASKDGLGCVLMQEGHPVAYASRTLSSSEQKWAQIEKELLAIAFACERFHFLLYGREFLVQSDHKPLETLVKRDIDDVTPRLQRMFMFLLKYPKMTIVYTPGKEMLVADCLSRAQLPEICSERMAHVSSA